MQRFVIYCLVLFVPTQVCAADDAKDEIKKLEGAWKVASAEADGKPFEVKNLGMSQMVVRDGKLIFRNEAKELMSFTFTVDPAKKPKHMDWKKEGEPNPLPTIYALDGDELKLCFPLLPRKAAARKWMSNVPIHLRPRTSRSWYC